MGYTELSLAQKAMYDESRVDRVSTGVSIHLPKSEKLQAKYPHLTFQDDDWKAVSRALKDYAMGKLQAPPLAAFAADTRNVVRLPVAPRKGTSAHVPARGASDVPVFSEREARIRELSGERLVQVAVANAVDVAIHPTNPGITAMRRKNALLVMMRRNVPIKNL